MKFHSDVHFTDKSGFFTNGYVLGCSSLLHQSVPGVESSPLVLGVPIPFVLHNLASVMEKPNAFSLSSYHLQQFGCEVKQGEIMQKYMDMHTQQGIPTWPMQVVFQCANDGLGCR
jgi:hypothetical protein